MKRSFFGLIAAMAVSIAPVHAGNLSVKDSGLSVSNAPVVKASDADASRLKLDLPVLAQDASGLVHLAQSTDDQAEIDRLDRSCAQNNHRACFDLAELYKKRGSGYATEVAVFYEKACLGKIKSACYRLGYQYERGDGVAKSTNQALYWQKYGCDVVDYRVSCSAAGRLLKGEEKYTQARIYYSKACDMGFKSGCTQRDKLPGFDSSNSFSGMSSEDNTKASNYKVSCEGGNRQDCHNLGGLLRKYGDQYGSQMVTYYSKACDLGYGASCYQLASSYEGGRGVFKSIDNAINWYKRGCDDNDDRASCNGAARLYKRQSNMTRAREYYTKGCNLGFQTSCTALKNLGGGSGGGNSSYPDFSADELQKLTRYKNACNAGTAGDCLNAAELFTKKGTKYPNEVISYYKKGCEGRHNSSCYRLGYAYEKGRYGIQQSISQALYWQRYGCDTVGYDISCSSAGRVYKGQGNISSAKTYYSKACNKGYSSACTQLQKLQGDDGSNNNKNADFTSAEQQKLRSFKNSCDAGTASACFDVAELYKFKGTKYPNEVVSYYKRACEGRYNSACYRLGYAYEKGQYGIAQSTYQAISWQKYGCDTVGYDISCSSAGRLYKGQGDTSQAKTYYKKACDKGYKSACTQLEKLGGGGGNDGGGGSSDDLQANLSKCTNGDAQACNKVAIHYKKEGATDIAADYYGRSCNAGYASACYWIAYQYERVDGLNKSIDQAIVWQKKGCAGDNRTSCNALGRLYNSQGDSSNSRYYYTRACSLGYSSACNQLNK